MNLEELKKLSDEELKLVAGDCRKKIKETCHQNGGHLGGSLGAVELTLALEKVFNSPEDKIVFDVGHQSYTHKLVTDREEKFSSLRKKNGLSGFMNPKESEHDPCVTGHAGNSLSMALGLSYNLKKNHWTVAVIGDGSFLNGMVVEALNHLATLKQNVLIIINDNQYSIDECVGKIAADNKYQQFCQSFDLPYTGIIDGHNLLELIKVLTKIKQKNGPQILHVRTKKGFGDEVASAKIRENHFCASDENLAQNRPKLQNFVGTILRQLGEKNQQMSVITPAMKSSSGLTEFAEKFPERFFDVGIAEEHALTFGAGLALAGKKPFCHFYASFLQRAYDQLIHDVAINQAPVVVLVDRFGLIGEDGPTHQGTLALAFLNSVPDLEILLPGNLAELKTSLEYGVKTKKPLAICYPKLCLETEKLEKQIATENLQPKKIREGKTNKLAVISTGFIRETVEKISQDLDFTHWHFCKIKPLAGKTIVRILNQYEKILVVEENQKMGGFGQQIATVLSEANLPKPPQLIIKAVPNKFIEQAHRTEQLQMCGLDEKNLTELIRKIRITN